MIKKYPDLNLVNNLGPHKGRQGALFVEVVVGILILSIILVGATITIQNVNKGLTRNRLETKLQNLVDEVLEDLRNRGYDNIPTTNYPNYDRRRKVHYDASNFPPKTIKVGRHPFKIYIYAHKVKKYRSYSQKQWDSFSDIGQKEVYVTVVGRYHNKDFKKGAKALISDPRVQALTGKITGYTYAQDGTPLKARVYTSENYSLYTRSDSNGFYTLDLPVGQWKIFTYAWGYKTKISDPINVPASPPNNPVQQNFFLEPFDDYGTVKTYIYYADHLLVSQVGHVGGDNYIEIFNPTTNVVPLASVGVSLDRGSLGAVANLVPQLIGAVPEIQPQSFYLITDAATGIVGGKTADARSNPADSPLFELAGLNGGVQVSWDGRADALGWYNTAVACPTFPLAGFYETTPMGLGGGFPVDFQLTRAVSTGTYQRTYLSDNNQYGPAYDMSNNSVDFAAYTSLDPNWIPPFSSADGNTLLVSGSPAFRWGYPHGQRSLVWAEDGRSHEGRTATKWFGPFETTALTLTLVTTGTQKMHYVSHNSGTQYEIMGSTIGIVVEKGVTNFVPNSITIPPWPADDPNRSFVPALIANSPVSGGIRYTWVHIYGRIRGRTGGVYGLPIDIPGRTDYAFMSYKTYLPQEPITLTMNDGPKADPAFGAPLIQTYSLSSYYTRIEYIGSGECIIAGVVTNNLGAKLKNVPILAFDNSNDSGVGTTLTQPDGSYQLRLFSDKEYKIIPNLQGGQLVQTPSVGYHIVPTAGLPIDLRNPPVLGNKNFVVLSKSLGHIVGQLTYQGKPITESVVVMVTTGSLSGGFMPNAITPERRSNGELLYADISDHNGNFKVALSANRTYVVSGWYKGIKKEVATSDVQIQSDLTVNLTWP